MILYIPFIISLNTPIFFKKVQFVIHTDSYQGDKFDTENVPSAVYFMRIEMGEEKIVIRAIQEQRYSILNTEF